MPVLLSDEELQALEGLPHLHRCLYIFGIRRYMDYSTGITGIKREISYKSLSEEAYVAPRRGSSDTGSQSRDQVKRALIVLEQAGLIKRKSIVTNTEKKLILECVLAKTDSYVQNKAAPYPPHSPAPKAALEIYNEQKAGKHYKNNGEKVRGLSNKKTESRPESRPAVFEKAARHPLSGKDTKLNYTYARENFAHKPVDNFLTPEENQFMNLFTDLRLTVKPAGDLKAIVAAKALVVAGVTVEEASEALKIKLNGYSGDRNPHPSYFTQAIIDYKRDLDAINNKQETINDETNRPRAAEPFKRVKVTHAERRARMDRWLAKKLAEQEHEEGPESDNMAF